MRKLFNRKARKAMRSLEEPWMQLTPLEKEHAYQQHQRALEMQAAVKASNGHCHLPPNS